MDLKGLQSFLETEAAKRDMYEREASAARRRQRTFEEIAGIVRRLCHGWQTSDPGKYGVYVFLVRDIDIDGETIRGVEAFQAKELIDAHDGRPECPVPVAGLQEALLGTAECCTKKAPMIGTYEQTCDSAEGDTWEMRVRTLCLECAYLTPVAHRTSAYRMSLRMPKYVLDGSTIGYCAPATLKGEWPPST